MNEHIFTVFDEYELTNVIMSGKTSDNEEIAYPFLAEVKGYVGTPTYRYNDIAEPYVSFRVNEPTASTGYFSCTNASGTVYTSILTGDLTLTTEDEWITLSQTASTSADTAVTFTLQDNTGSTSTREGTITASWNNGARVWTLTVNQYGNIYIEATYVVTASSQTVQFYSGGTNTYRDKVEVYDDQGNLLQTISNIAGAASYTFTSAGTYKAKLYLRNDATSSATSGWGPVANTNYNITAMTVNVAKVQNNYWNSASYNKLKVVDFCDRTYSFGQNSFRNMAMTDLYFRYTGDTAFTLSSGSFGNVKTSSGLTVHYASNMTEANLNKLKAYFTNATFTAIV